MKTTQAETSVEIWLHCPHCDEFQERFEDLRDALDYNELRAEECDEELKCECCNEYFIVNKITY